MQYMAPELVRGEADHPSTETDLHSLAVLLFQLWVWHHPLHGTMEYDVRCWDDPARKKIYGITPVFIFDPTDDRNRLPNDPTYAIAARRWAICPPSLQALFLHAFTDGTEGARATGHGGRMAEPVPPAQGRGHSLSRLPGRQSLGARHDGR